MIIKNKQESDFWISEKNLNRMFEKRCTNKTSLSEIEKYLSMTNFSFYNLRDKSNSAGAFKYKLTKEEVISELQKEHYKEFSVMESLAIADSTLILQGDIEISSDFILKASLSDIQGISNRKAMEEPKYNLFNIDLKTEKEPNIRGLSKVIDYICKNELIGMIVEFSLFGIPVGIKQEPIIIWELRNY